MKIGGEDFVCLTDMAKLKSEDPSFTINHWIRNRMTIEYLGLWEELYNPNFKPTEFGRFREESGLNSFTLSSTRQSFLVRQVMSLSCESIHLNQMRLGVYI